MTISLSIGPQNRKALFSTRRYETALSRPASTIICISQLASVIDPRNMIAY